MNNTKKTIGWCDFSWNVVTGCLHRCWYCYANRLFTRFHRSFEPTFHPERLGELCEYNLKHKKPVKIFVGSVCDLYAPWTPKKWRDCVFAAIEQSEVPHAFQLLTKNPENIPRDVSFKPNIWHGTTVTGEGDDWKNMEAIQNIHGNRFISFEPLLAEVEPFIPDVDWVIIGKLTGSRRVKLKWEWISKIKMACQDYGIPLFIKNNVYKEFPNMKVIQEFPEGMPH